MFLKFWVKTYTVKLLVGALQTLLGPLGLHQILQTVIKERPSQKGGGGSDDGERDSQVQRHTLNKQ